MSSFHYFFYVSLRFVFFFFFFNDTATTEIYTLSLHDALPIYRHGPGAVALPRLPFAGPPVLAIRRAGGAVRGRAGERSEEHTSELQSRLHLVCRLLLEKKKETQSVAELAASR